MNKLIFISLFVFLYISNICFGQVTKKVNDSLTCDSTSNNNYDTIIINNSIVQYKLLCKYESHYDTKKHKISYIGDVIMPNLLKKLNKKNIEYIFQELMKKHDIDEMIGFKNSEARTIFYQAMKPLAKQKQYLKENLIGIFTRK